MFYQLLVYLIKRQSNNNTVTIFIIKIYYCSKNNFNTNLNQQGTLVINE